MTGECYAPPPTIAPSIIPTRKPSATPTTPTVTPTTYKPSISSVPTYFHISTVTTYVGGVSDGFSGDGSSTTGHFTGAGGVATAAELEVIQGVCGDTLGSIYTVHDFGVRKIDAFTNIITNFVGDRGGIGMDKGDGGAATSATFGYGHTCSLDSVANVYLAATNVFFRVRKVSASDSIISTWVGSGHSGFNGDGGPATSASVGNAEWTGYRVHIITPQGIISTFAGCGVNALTVDGARASSATIPGQYVTITGDSNGNVFIGVRIRVLVVDSATTVVATIAGSSVTGFTGDGGPGLSAKFYEIKQMAVFGSSVFIPESSIRSGVRELSVNQDIFTNGFFERSIPTGLPSQKSTPSRAPSLRPSYVMTRSPTLYPTFGVPSLAPTTVNGISYHAYQTNSKVHDMVLKAGIAATMTGVVPENIINWRVGTDSGSKSTLQMLVASVEDISLVYTVSVDLPSSETVILSSQLNSAVSTGLFNAYLAGFTQQYDTPALIGVSSLVVEITQTASYIGASECDSVEASKSGCSSLFNVSMPGCEDKTRNVWPESNSHVSAFKTDSSSNEPTIEPSTRKPTLIPTTLKPTMKAVPTRTPTMYTARPSTSSPSHKPSSSAAPTTIVPTFRPTTSDANGFDVVQIISGITFATYQTNPSIYDKALKWAIAATMAAVSPSDIIHWMVEDGSSSSLRLLTSFDSLSLSYTVRTSGALHDPVTLPVQLSTAISTGLFNDYLAGFARQFGASGLIGVTSNSVETSVTS
eukprot:gene23870-30146_t